ncbi:hypothetical protein KSP39_PZI013262 [Platanthera zijinensis]|uniref:Uncharacterized protein n=1 Tax=Platanthera zijinensis TaxID=2320716 RepID=A0AAP0G3E0_9ASPA
MTARHHERPPHRPIEGRPSSPFDHEAPDIGAALLPAKWTDTSRPPLRSYGPPLGRRPTPPLPPPTPTIPTPSSSGKHSSARNLSWSPPGTLPRRSSAAWNPTPASLPTSSTSLPGSATRPASKPTHSSYSSTPAAVRHRRRLPPPHPKRARGTHAVRRGARGGGDESGVARKWAVFGGGDGSGAAASESDACRRLPEWRHPPPAMTSMEIPPVLLNYGNRRSGRGLLSPESSSELKGKATF